jgi:hypothetical protein
MAYHVFLSQFGLNVDAVLRKCEESAWPHAKVQGQVLWVNLYPLPASGQEHMELSA